MGCFYFWQPPPKGVRGMYFKKRILGIFRLVILGSLNSGAFARISHDVSIRVAEISRYQLANKEHSFPPHTIPSIYLEGILFTGIITNRVSA